MNCILFVKMDQVFSKENKTLKILENWKKYWKSQGILSVRKSGNPDNSKRNGEKQFYAPGIIVYSHWLFLE